MTIANGTYRPNQPGARTWREARAFTVNGEHVSAEVNEGTVTVFVGTRLIITCPIPSDVLSAGDLYAWIIATAQDESEREADESGASECECCGLPIMVSNVRAQNYCEDCDGPDCPGSGSGIVFESAWHCPTGRCDGSGCYGAEHLV